jgi:GH25 family lysozyme M1 (1,4-beta-N-acetylmuramidase)
VTAGPGPMMLQQNPHALDTPERTEWDDIFSRTLDPRRERRMVRHLADQQVQGGGTPLTPELPEQLAGLSATGVLFGPDCSQYQGRPDWAAVAKAGCTLGGYKVSEGRTYTDPSHAYNRSAVPAAGLVPMGYHFLYWSTEYSTAAMWAAQADHFCALADPDAIHALDVEMACAAGSHTDVDAWIAGYRRHYPRKPLIIYSNQGLWVNRARVATSWPAGAVPWHAGYRNGLYTRATGALTTEWAATGALSNSLAQLGAPDCQLWQFTDHAAVPGISGTCDGNAFLGTRAELEALATGDTDVPLTEAEKDELVIRTATEVWQQGLNSAFDGKSYPAGSLLSNAHRYAAEASLPIKRPVGSSLPGTPTYALQLMGALAGLAQATDTLEASEAAQAVQLAALAALTPEKLADAIAAKLGGSADVAEVKEAVLDALREGMPTFNIVAEQPAPPQ